MFGSKESPELMPLPIILAHKLVQETSLKRKDGTLSYLRPDSKSQVSIKYIDGMPTQIENVVIATLDHFNIKAQARPDAPGVYVQNKKIHQNEIICDINIKYTPKLKSTNISKKNIVSMIDEIPIFSLICAFAHGTSNIEGANELRYKESDRIHSIVHNFKKLNINIKEFKDGFSITGPNRLHNTTINNFSDHRIAMIGEIINLITNKSLSAESETKSLINTSFPEFYSILKEYYE